MPWKTIAPIAAGLTLAACTSMPPSLPPTPIRIPPPSACGHPCPELPRLEAETESGVVIWVHEVINSAGVCRRQHDECRSAR